MHLIEIDVDVDLDVDDVDDVCDVVEIDVYRWCRLCHNYCWRRRGCRWCMWCRCRWCRWRRKCYVDEVKWMWQKLFGRPLAGTFGKKRRFVCIVKEFERAVMDNQCVHWSWFRNLLQSGSQTLCGTYEYWDWAAWSFGISCCMHARISSTSFIFTHFGKILLTHHHPNLDAAIAIRYTTFSCKTP